MRDSPLVALCAIAMILCVGSPGYSDDFGANRDNGSAAVILSSQIGNRTNDLGDRDVYVDLALDRTSDSSNGNQCQFWAIAGDGGGFARGATSMVRGGPAYKCEFASATIDPTSLTTSATCNVVKTKEVKEHGVCTGAVAMSGGTGTSNNNAYVSAANMRAAPTTRRSPATSN